MRHDDACERAGSAASAARLDEIVDLVNGWHETQRTTTWVVPTEYARQDHSPVIWS